MRINGPVGNHTMASRSSRRLDGGGALAMAGTGIFGGATRLAYAVVAALSAPAFAQEPSLLQATPMPIQLGLVLPAAAEVPSFPATRLDPAVPADAPPPASTPERPLSYGLEIDFRSGYADRGILISDRPVVQAIPWLSGPAGRVALWTNVALDETSDNSRPQILEVDLSHEQHWGRLSVVPEIEIYEYRDPVSADRSRSIESWVYVSYRANPVRIFTNHSVDVAEYRGAYFGEAGIEVNREVSRTIEIGTSISGGWGSRTFNEEFFDVDRAAFNLVRVEGWLTTYLTRSFYVASHFQINQFLDRALRAAVARPTMVFVGLAMGVEF